VSKWSLSENEWLNCERPSRMIRHLGHDPRNRKQMLLAAACLRRVWDWLLDPRSRRAVEVAEQFADGLATEAELRAVREAALQLFSEPGEPLPRKPHWKMYALPAEAAGMNESVIDAVMYIADATAWGKVDTPEAVSQPEERAQAELVRDIFGNPFRPVVVDPSWRTAAVVALARGIYEERAFERLPMLADALQDAGCEDDQVLGHCRYDGPHVRGCWVVDLLLGKA
jgi:hypothetical protein